MFRLPRGGSTWMPSHFYKTKANPSLAAARRQSKDHATKLTIATIIIANQLQG
jgi:hypothetical protein